MLLPFREHLDFGPTPYDRFQAKEGIPVVKGNVISDVLALELWRWERIGAWVCFLNLSHQQQTDAYVCEIPAGSETLPQRHLFEEIIYVTKGRGATAVWQDGAHTDQRDNWRSRRLAEGVAPGQDELARRSPGERLVNRARG